MSSNVYYDAKDFGLTPVVEIEYSSGSYEFDTRVVWRTADGKLLTARDSGCSCPTPFEDFAGLPALDDFDPKVILAEIDKEAACEYGDFTPDEAARARAEVRALA